MTRTYPVAVDADGDRREDGSSDADRLKEQHHRTHGRREHTAQRHGGNLLVRFDARCDEHQWTHGDGNTQPSVTVETY